MKIPFGMWRVTLPAWDQKSPPPHPDQHPYEKVQRWVTTPTLILLLEDEDTGGAGYDLTELDLAEAYVQQLPGAAAGTLVRPLPGRAADRQGRR